MGDDDLQVELTLAAKRAVLPGGLEVRRAIPQARRRMVGPFVFVDQMGPAVIDADEVTVLPHPHIGLSTVTYLFEGEGLHRDSLGTVQRILPGEVNWMTAGRGIVHSERLRAGPSGRVFGVQIWVALPRALEESEPTFEHYDASAVPRLEERGASIALIAGTLFGARSEVRTSSPLVYAEARLEPGARLTLTTEHHERAVFVVEGAARTRERALAEGEIAFFRPEVEVAVESVGPSRLIVLGGEPLDGPRHIRWNFVSSSKERLAQAADDWRDLRFPRIPGETRYIPLPENGADAVDYP